MTGSPTLRPVATRGARTREHILDVAEQLYGSQGVAHVSLRQIRIAAGQGNDAAVQYHFGDRDGIIRALTARHHPPIAEIVARLRSSHGETPSTRQLVAALVQPWVEYATHGPGERAFLRIVAELSADPTLGFDTIQQNAIPELTEIGTALYERLTTELDTDLAVERLWTLGRFALQAAADRARLVDAGNARRPALPDAAFIENVVAMAYGALPAPLER